MCDIKKVPNRVFRKRIHKIDFYVFYFGGHFVDCFPLYCTNFKLFRRWKGQCDESHMWSLNNKTFLESKETFYLMLFIAT